MLIEIMKYLHTCLPPDTIIEKEECYIIPTICHNADHKSASHKLYLYKNQDSEEYPPLFHCFTECSATFNIYQLVQKIEALKGNKIDYWQAYKIVHGSRPQITKKIRQDNKPIPIPTKSKDPREVQLTEYNHHILDLFPIKENHPWFLIDGITLDTLSFFRCGYNKNTAQVAIPCRDQHARLIGVRARNFNNGQDKYKPLYIDGTLYTFPTSLNFFGLLQNQQTIKKTKSVILVEGEKQVLLGHDLGINNLLATYGNNISRWQVDYLTKVLGVETLFIGYDKEYHSNFDSIYEYKKLLQQKFDYAKGFMNIVALIDEDGHYSYKESIFDRSISEFTSLRKHNI